MLIGRDEEIERLASLIGDQQLAVITGPAGIGKTSLAGAALERHGASWAEAGALATLAWAPMLLFRRLLRAHVGDDPEAVAASVLRHGWHGILLDDLQWADAASLDVISHLANQVAMVATVRTGEERSAVVVELLELLGAVRLDLGPLPVAVARQLVGRLHPDLSMAELDSVVQRAGGNALLLTELPTAGGDAPTLVSALLARLGALDAIGRAAAERLAVLGRPARAELVGAGAASVVAVGLAFAEEEWLTMRHGLLAEVIVDLLGDDADRIRRDLASEVDDSEAAHLLAAAGDLAAARRTARRAAAVITDPWRRVELLQLAIRCAPPEVADADLRVEAGRLLVDLSQPGRAIALCSPPGFDQLDRRERGALRTVEAEAAWLQGQTDRCQEIIEEGLADLRGTGTAEEAFALAGSTIFDTRHRLDGRPALERAREAVALADQVGAHQRFARLRLASVLMTADEPGWAELYADVIDDARVSGDEPARRTALTSLVLAQWVAGDPIEAHRLAWEDVELGPTHDHDGNWLANHAYAAIIGLLVGVDQELLVERHDAVLAAEPLFRNRQFMEAAVGLALADLGRSAEATGHADGAPGRAGHNPQARSVGWWLVAEVAWLDGRLDDAVGAAAGAAALGVGDYPSAVLARLIGGHAVRELGGRELEGSAPGQLLRAWSGAPLEWRALATAVEGRHQQAVSEFDQAADAWRGHDVRSEARCRLAAADEARLAGADDAVARLRAAAELAESRRTAPLVARARRSLRAAGVTSRIRAVPGRTILTGREEEVLRLVGVGRTSPDIAAALGVKVSTVDSFVRSATRKLGCSTRLAAAARLQELDQRSG